MLYIHTPTSNVIIKVQKIKAYYSKNFQVKFKGRKEGKANYRDRIAS